MNRMIRQLEFDLTRLPLVFFTEGLRHARRQAPGIHSEGEIRQTFNNSARSP